MGLLRSLLIKWSAAKAKRRLAAATEHERIGDVAGAILDYTAIVRMESMPAEWMARARLGRAGAYWKEGSVREAFDDIAAVLEMPDAPDECKNEARRLKHSFLGRG